MKSKSKKEQFYDGKAVNYMPKQRGILGYLRDSFVRFEKHRHDACVELLPTGSKNLLDIGSHDGLAMIKALRKIKGKATGFDISQKAINEARKNLQKEGLEKRGVLVKGDSDENLPFKNGQFDSVLCIAVLEHVFDPIFLIKEINRVLKKGGALVVEVPNLAFLPRRLTLLLGGRPRTSWGYGWDGGHLQYFTMGDLVNLLETYGFQIKTKTGSGVFNDLRKFWPSLLFANLIISAKKDNESK